MAWPYDDEQSVMTPEAMAEAYRAQGQSVQPLDLPDYSTGQTVAPEPAPGPEFSSPATRPTGTIAAELRSRLPADVAGILARVASGASAAPRDLSPSEVAELSGDVAPQVPQAQPAGPALMRPRAEPRPTVPYPLALQYGGRYGLPPEQYTAEQARLIREGKIDPGQMLEGVQQYDRYSRSPWGLGAQMVRSGVAGDIERGEIQAGLMRDELGRIDARREAYASYEREAAAIEQQRQEIQRRKEAAVSRAMASYRGAVERLDNSGVDPDRWWKERGTGGGILAAIAVGLGALGSTWGKTPNYALDIIQSSIDRDIDAQKATLENKRSALAARQTLVGQLYDYYGDMDQAVKASKSYAWEKVIGQVKQIGMSSEKADVKARVADFLSRAHQMKLDSETQMMLDASTAEEQAIVAQQQAAAAAAQAQAAKRAQLAEGEVVTRPNEVYSDLRKGLVSYVSPREATAARTKVVLAQRIRDAAGNLTQSMQEGEKWTGEGRGRANLEMAAIKDDLAASGYPEVAKALPDVNALFSAEGTVLPGKKRAFYEALNGLGTSLELGATAGREVIPATKGRLIRDESTGTSRRSYLPSEPIQEVQIRGGKGGRGRGASGGGGGSDIESAVDEAVGDKGSE